MIVTVTANPSTDRAVALPGPLVPGEVQRAESSREDAGGKGVNVARVVSAAGAPARAVVPVNDHDPYRLLLDDAGVDLEVVPVAGRVRANLTITDPRGETTKLNLPGAELSPAEARAQRRGGRRGGGRDLARPRRIASARRPRHVLRRPHRRRP